MIEACLRVSKDSSGRQVVAQYAVPTYLVSQQLRREGFRAISSVEDAYSLRISFVPSTSHHFTRTHRHTNNSQSRWKKYDWDTLHPLPIL